MTLNDHERRNALFHPIWLALRANYVKPDPYWGCDKSVVLGVYDLW